ncbi:hypothetical protein HWV62_9781 [Athelia sp. TMB]|nr:hypothetical protein HWV62_9781 [Athelia sp. TMB]
MLKQAILRPFGLLHHSRILTSRCSQPVTGISVVTRNIRTSTVWGDEKRTDIISDTKPTDQPQNHGPDAPFTSEEHSRRQTPESLNSSALDLEALRTRFRELSWQSVAAVRQRTDEFTVNTAKTFSQLGAHLNKVTGYEEIESLKKRVIEQEDKIEATREAARQAKKAYENAVLQRSSSQREVNDLLNRKNSGWSDADRSRFTTIMLQEHDYDREEKLAKSAVTAAEDALDREFSELMRTILARYHDEQVWSDKIRSASTYGTMAAIALNLLVFISATILIEPWKRRRMAKMFEKKIEDLSAQNATTLEAGMEHLTAQFEAHERRVQDVMKSVSSRGSEANVASSAPSNAASAAAAKASMERTVQRIIEATENREDIAILVLCAVTAGSMGWFARQCIG